MTASAGDAIESESTRWDQPFWSGAREGVLRYQRCSSCGRASFPVRRFCPTCASEALTWEDSRGRGTLYSFSVVERGALAEFAEQLPYVVGVVELEEGFRMSSRVVRAEPGALRCDMLVRVVFDDETVSLPCFVLSEERAV